MFTAIWLSQLSFIRVTGRFLVLLRRIASDLPQWFAALLCLASPLSLLLLLLLLILLLLLLLLLLFLLLLLLLLLFLFLLLLLLFCCCFVVLLFCCFVSVVKNYCYHSYCVLLHRVFTGFWYTCITVMYQDRLSDTGEPSPFGNIVHSSLSLLQYTMGQVRFRLLFFLFFFPVVFLFYFVLFFLLFFFFSWPLIYSNSQLAVTPCGGPAADPRKKSQLDKF